jgi:sporulation protein YlmC with PRC-barrel domain
MSTLGRDQLLELRGQDLHDSHGDKIGKIDEIYLDRESGEPEWALVNTGLFGTKSSFVPVRDASRHEGTLSVPYEKGKVKDAPNMRRRTSSTATTSSTPPASARPAPPTPSATTSRDRPPTTP